MVVIYIVVFVCLALFLYWFLLVQLGSLLMNYSKPVVGAITAFLIGNTHKLVANGWGNWFIWLAICLAVLYGLSLLRYVGMSINFFCGLLISSVGLRLLGELTGMIFSVFTQNESELSTIVWLILTVFAWFFAIGYAMEGDEKMAQHSTGALPVLQAILATPVYGIGVALSCTDLCLRLWPAFTNVGDYLLIGTSILALVIQLFTFCKKHNS